MRIDTTQTVPTELSPPSLMPRSRPLRVDSGGGAELSHVRSDTETDLTHLAQKWVAQTFFGPLLAQMRNSPFKSELFSGGRGGEAFAALFDQHLAERMARSVRHGLAQSIVRHIQRADHRTAQAPQGNAIDGPSHRAAPAVAPAWDGGE